MYNKLFVIARAGCNHMGQMETAKELIQTAAYFCKVDAIKLQNAARSFLYSLKYKGS